MNWIKHIFYSFFCVVLIGCNSEGTFVKEVLSEQTEREESATTKPVENLPTEQIENLPTEPIDNLPTEGTPSSPMLLSIEIKPKPFSIVQNPESQDYLLGTDYEADFVATGYYEDGSEQDITQQVTWSVNDNYVARMESNVLTGKQKGRIKVQASLGPYISNALDVLINPVGLVTWGMNVNHSNYVTPPSYIPAGIRSVTANDFAFSAVKLDGTVTTFGEKRGGAFAESQADACQPSCAEFQLQSRLVNVKKIASTQSSVFYSTIYNEGFVALKENGLLEWWARPELIHPDYGIPSWRGDYDNARDIVDVMGHHGSYYALTRDGKVLGFGYLDSTSNFEQVRGDLVDVKKLVASPHKFTIAALKQDGTAILFGGSHAAPGRYPAEEFVNIVDIEPLLYGFIAYREDGSAVYWGNGVYRIESQVYSSVKKAYSSAHHGVILTHEGDLIDMRTHELILAGDTDNPVVDVVATSSGGLFAALLANGEVFSWGEATGPGNQPYTVYGSGQNIDYQDVASELVDVIKLHATNLAILAVKKDGSVVTWGDAHNGGDSSSVKDELVNVIDVQDTNLENGNVVTALKQDGSLVFWGNSFPNKAIASEYKNVAHILHNKHNFVGIQVWQD